MVFRSRRLQHCLVAASVLVASSCNAFPTAENFAKLVRPGPADVVDDFPAVHEQLLRLRQKRLLVDDLSGDPIDGACRVVYYLYIPWECPSFWRLIGTRDSTVSGDHAFQAPDLDNGDQRGPCPGLNALANHGYIPHDGVVGVGFDARQAGPRLCVSADKSSHHSLST